MIKYTSATYGSYYFTNETWTRIVESRLNIVDWPPYHLLQMSIYAVSPAGKLIKQRAGIETILDAALLD
jgi:hypothetical protein